MAAVALAAASPASAQRSRAAGGRARGAAPVGCPRPATWAAIRDSLWPLIVHRDGDSAWAHLEPDSLPRRTASWCNPLDGNGAALVAGPSIYRQHCATCHGAAGQGHGPGAGIQLPPPFDFTTPTFAGMRVPPGPGVLYAIVSRGIGGTAMPAFPDLGPWERLAVLSYITKFPGDSAVEAQQAWADTLKARRPH